MGPRIYFLRTLSVDSCDRLRDSIRGGTMSERALAEPRPHAREAPPSGAAGRAHQIVTTARGALVEAPQPGSREYLGFCASVAEALARRWHAIEAANSTDLEQGGARGLSDPFLDRIRLGS